MVSVEKLKAWIDALEYEGCLPCRICPHHDACNPEILESSCSEDIIKELSDD